MKTYHCVISYQLTDNVTGEITTHTGNELTLPAIDALQAETAARESIQLAAGKRATVTGLSIHIQEVKNE